jgi:Domain of unknown function (DUF4430)
VAGSMTLTMILSIDGRVIRAMDDIPWSAGMTVQDAMEHAYRTKPGYSLLLHYAGPELGYRVTGIDGISNQSGTGVVLSWRLGINGIQAQKGIGDCVLSDGDLIEWDYGLYDLSG